MQAVDRVRGWLGRLPSRWPWLRLVVDVKARFDAVHGGYLASAVTLAAFLSVFPLLLVLTAAVGFFASGNTDLAGDVVSWFGLTGDAARIVTDAIAAAEANRAAASLVGLAGMLYSGLGVVAALNHAYDSVWQVQGRGIRDKLYGLAWLVGAGVLFLASFAITATVAVLPPFLAPLNLAGGLVLGTALFLWSSTVLCNRRVGWRALLPGALVGAAGFEVLKALGSFVLPRIVARSSALYGSIGIVFGVLAWLLLFGRLVVLASVLNVVRWERGHGTVTVGVEVPNLPGPSPTTGTRSGEADEPGAGAPPDAGTTGTFAG